MAIMTFDKRLDAVPGSVLANTSYLIKKNTFTYKAWRLRVGVTTPLANGDSFAVASSYPTGSDSETYTYFSENVTLSGSHTLMYDGTNGSIAITVVSGTATMGVIYDEPQTATSYKLKIDFSPLAPSAVSYVVEASNDTTTGLDGTWTVVADNPVVSNGTLTTVPLLGTGSSSDELTWAVTNGDATVTRQMPTSDDIQSMLEEYGDSVDHRVEVADISERDLMEYMTDTIVKVLDASGDPLIDTGPATYFYHKELAEFHLFSGGTNGALLIENEW